jgi:hypothetical protein
MQACNQMKEAVDCQKPKQSLQQENEPTSTLLQPRGVAIGSRASSTTARNTASERH